LPLDLEGVADEVVNLSLSSRLSVVEQFDTRRYIDTTPNELSYSKRKRDDNDVPASATMPKKAVKLNYESTPTKRIKKEPSPTQAKQNYHHTSPSSGPSRSRMKKEYGSLSPQYSADTLAPRVKIDPYISSESNQSILLSGMYAIQCPVASDIFGDYDLDFTLSLDPTRGIWWATFRWGAWDGIIRMNSGPSFKVRGESCPLDWRLRDLETGELRFGKKCTGHMTFFENQTFQGSLYNIPYAGTVAFEGRRLPGCNLKDDLQDEWDAFVSEAYGR
jgi:hypothetical protein